MVFVNILISILAIEIFLQILIRLLRLDFQWLITEEDECPKLDSESLKRFLAHGYDSELGWTRKPNTAKEEPVKTVGEERKNVKVSTYHTNEFGARSNPEHERWSSLISSFGDSFAFSRHVNDNETWQWYLSELTKSNVINFGVGNYGADQALKKLEKELSRFPAEIVLFMVVPETISRIQNVWKHYSEYGNLLGFKGRYFLQPGHDIRWFSNPIDHPEAFSRIKNHLKVIQENDDCYRKKFRKDQIRFPYSFHILKNPNRNIPLLFTLILRKLVKIIGWKNEKILNWPWELILKRNFDYTVALFQDKASRMLLERIIIEFKNQVERKEAIPIFVLVPYLHDLYLAKKGENPYYKSFVNEINKSVRTINIIDTFAKIEHPESLYVSTFCGAHFSAFGNKKVADEIYRYLIHNKLLTELPASAIKTG